MEISQWEIGFPLNKTLHRSWRMGLVSAAATFNEEKF